MKAKLLFKITLILILIHQLGVLNSFAQEVPFTPPLNNSSNLTLRGDMKIIANAVTGLSGDQSETGNSFFSGDTTDYNPNDPYNGSSSNDRLTQDYIDIDNDDTTFSSSSADFISGADCPKVAYAGLYWSATYYIDRVDAANGNNSPQLENLPVVDSRPDFKAVKLKLPGSSTYIDINTESEGVIYDGYRNTTTNPNDSASNDIPYVCYADVTTQLQALDNPDGTYTVANIRSATGLTEAGSGISGGWALVIIYEDPSLSRKQFSTQHGFLEIACENAFELAINNGMFEGQGFSHTDNIFNAGNIPLPDYPSGLTGDLVLVDDNNDQAGAGSVDDGCQTLVNGVEVDGKIAVLRRGACGFTQKVINAQNAGAIAVIVVNNNGGNDTIEMTGDDALILIPAVMIGNQNGNVIIDEIVREQGLGNSISITLSNNIPSGCVKAEKTFEYAGFETPPAPNPVNAKLGIASLEGDFGIVGDGLAINAVSLGGIPIPLSADPVNGATNFFNSSISVDGAYNMARNPASENTLGFDADIFDLPNAGNTIIANNQSSVEFVASTEGDSFRVFLNTLSIEVVDPELTGNSRVLDVNGNDITGGDLQFGQDFFYEFIIQNTGNENLTNTSVTSAIADNVDFVQGTLVTPSGVTAIYNNANREVVFTFDDRVVERLDPELTFRFGVKVVDSCQDLRDSCNGDIANTLLVSYTGQVSGIVASDTELSESPSCSFTLPPLPNFLDTTGDCDQEFSASICSGTLDLVAESGFSQYTWTDVNTNTTIGNLQTITVNSTGIYRVDKAGNPDCIDQTEIWTVNDFSSAENPVITVVNDPLVNGNIQTCAITGEFLPELFLCGSGTEQYIDSGFINTSSIIWERLDPVACASVVRDEDCPTLDNACDPDWVQVATTRDYTVTEAGEYRIRVEFDGNCNIDFYFNAFINDYELEVAVIRDIVCDSEGILRVVNPSVDYEYQLITPQGVTTPYQASSEFSGLVEEGEYQINARQNSGLPSACLSQANLVLSRIDPLISVNVNHPICNGDLGEINIMITNGNPSYVYKVTSTTNSFTITEGPIEFSDYTFNGLEAGTYDVEVLTNNGDCIFTETATVVTPTEITAEVSLIQDYICTADGIQFAEIMVSNPSGGNGDYRYSLDGIDFSNTTGVFTGLTTGMYNVFIVDTATFSCPVNAGVITVSPLEEIEIQLEVSPITTNNDGVITVNASGGIGGYMYELLDAIDDSVIIAAQSSNELIVSTAGDYIVKVIDSNGCFNFKEITVETTEDNPIVEYADEILFCALTGQSYPVINIENENGEVVDLSFTNVASILWQQLDEINCNVSFEENCPTIDDSCSSDWFDFQTGSSCTITEPGQYRVVITFNTKSGQNTKIYYFRADANLLDVEDVSISKINLYPNPANTIVNINTEVRSIRVFDLSGKIVLETTQKTFDIGRLENGVYFTEIETIIGGKKIIKLLKE